MTNFQRALTALEVARCRFDNATGPYIDVAALELRAAELRLSAVISAARAEAKERGC